MGLFGKKQRKYFAACEYWIYMPSDTMPEQEAVMTRMVGQNPYNASGHLAIGKREGILFTDIRLHISHVLRSKNPHVFRPDLFRDATEANQEVLEALSGSRAIVKLRYISEEPLGDDRHLQFMAHLACSYLDLGEGLAVYDVVAETFYTPEDFRELLKREFQTTAFDPHVRVIWHKTPHAGFAETKGLLKKGIPELKTDEAYLDQQVLVSQVLEQAARQIWSMTELPKQVDVAAYEDPYKLEIFPTRHGPYRVRILRVVASQA